MIRKDLKAALETAALAWLRYNQRCIIIARERWQLPEHFNGRPDACGITECRRVIQVELKMSMTDFRGDSKKRKANWKRDDVWKSYYLAPKELQGPIMAELEGTGSHWGVLTTSGFNWGTEDYPWLDVGRKALCNREAKILSVKEVLKSSRDMAATLVKAESVNAKLRHELEKKIQEIDLTKPKPVEH